MRGTIDRTLMMAGMMVAGALAIMLFFGSLTGDAEGGGLLSQGGRLIVRDNTFMDNAGIGVSFVNGAHGEIASNYVMWNGGSAICLFRAGSVDVGRNVTGGNLADRPGVCAERRH